MIPNILSVFRILLIPVFAACYFLLGDEYRLVAAGVLLLSGLTDVVDGFIARRFNMITYAGKILDPLADKLTLFAVLLSVSSQIPPLMVLTVIFGVRELCMLFGGLALIRSGRKIIGSKWFGKISTAVLYICLLLFIVCPRLRARDPLSIALMTAMGVTVVFAFIMYVRVFFQLRQGDGNDEPESRRPLN